MPISLIVTGVFVANAITALFIYLLWRLKLNEGDGKALMGVICIGIAVAIIALASRH